MFQSQPFGILSRTLALALIATAHVASPATNIVTSTADNNSPGTLRRLIADSAAGDTVIFAPALSGATILLTNLQGPELTALVVNFKNLTIDASALPGGIQINGNHSGCVIKVYGSTAVLAGLTITNGYAIPFDYSSGINGDGGGVYNSGNLTLNRCTVVGNTANPYVGDAGHPPGHGGGGICNLGTLTVNECTIAANTLSRGVGAGIYNNSILAVNRSTLSGNAGSAIEIGQVCPIFCGPSGARTTVNQVTLTGNSNGIISISTNATVINQSTLSGNSGAALSGTFTITNSIVAENGSSGGTLTNSANNLIDVAANLYPLGNYGGPTLTMPPLPGSPAIDGCTSGTIFTTDQRGYPRTVDGDGDTIAVADIGAVESPAFPDGPGSFTGINKQGNTFQFSFLGNSGVSYTVLASPDLILPIEAWLNLGPVLESPTGSGQYQFTDPNTTDTPSRFYRVRSP